MSIGTPQSIVPVRTSGAVALLSGLSRLKACVIVDVVAAVAVSALARCSLSAFQITEEEAMKWDRVGVNSSWSRSSSLKPNG